MGTFLLGFGVGVVGGILMAPRPGAHYRQIVADKAGEGMDYLKRQTGEIRDSASDVVERGRDVVGQQIEKAMGSTPEQVFQR